MNRLIQKFEPEVSEKRKYTTPGTSRFKILSTTQEMEVLDFEFQKKHRSGVGMMLYLTKYSCLDISNVVWDCMHSATWGTYQEML